MESEIVIPGEFIGNINEYEAGENTYILKNEIRSKILGKVYVTYNNENIIENKIENENEDENDNEIDNENVNIILKPIINVEGKNNFVLPKIGDIVICRITKITFFMIYCDIIISNNKPIKYPFKGIINKGDIYVGDGILGETFECFNEDDIVKAMVISLGMNSIYKLTTVGKHLGVIIAVGPNYEILKPVAWNLVCSLKDKTYHQRKVSCDAVDFFEAMKKN